MIGFIKSLFSVDSVVETATKIIDKVAGTDFTSKEKADWILKWQEATKHQSPMRRLISGGVFVVWFSMVMLWLINSMVGVWFGFDQGIQAANAIKVQMGSMIEQPFNLVIGFYFTVSILQGFKK